MVSFKATAGGDQKKKVSKRALEGELKKGEKGVANRGEKRGGIQEKLGGPGGQKGETPSGRVNQEEKPQARGNVLLCLK